MFEFSDEYIKKLLREIYDGKVTRYSLPSSLYFAIANYLKKGLYEGFGAPTELTDARDIELISELRNNIYMFSAAKTYQQVREMSDLVYDAETTVRSFSSFKQEATKVFEQYNVDWLSAEYTTAIGQAQMASKWNEIVKDAAILPMLEYDAIGDACSICKPLDGTTLPVTDPFWRTYAPLNHFGCFCIIKQHVDKAIKEPEADVLAEIDEKMNAVFKGNSGIDRVIFNEEHSYFTNVPREDKGFARDNFDLPIPSE